MESLFSRRVLRTRGRRAAARGFTLIEMLVVLVIIVIISAIALSGQTTFSRTEALNNAAYDIGLSIREAQSYGLSNSLNKGSTSAFYNVPFGIALGGTTDTTHYVLFQDISPGPKCNTPACPSGNGEYDPNASPPDVAVKTYALNNGFSFASFCAFDGANTVCSTDSPNPITKLSITFGSRTARRLSRRIRRVRGGSSRIPMPA